MNPRARRVLQTSLVLVMIVLLSAAVAQAQYPKAGTSQYWAGKANDDQRVDNPTGEEYYALIIFYSQFGRLNMGAPDGNNPLFDDQDGCEGLVVPAHGSARCDDCGGNIELGNGTHPYELIAVPTDGGRFDWSGASGLGIISSTSKHRAAPLPPRLLKPPTVMSDRLALMECICNELAEDSQPADLFSDLGLNCPT